MSAPSPDLPPSASAPLVSIIVPSFNQGAFIRKTIETCLAQEYRPLQILVIDGGSRDATVDVLKSFGSIPELQWISEPDRGVVDAVNKGFALARGEFCAIQSSDDYYLPGAVRAGVEALRADPSLGFVFGDILKVDAEGRELMRTSLAPYSLENILSLRTWIPQPSTFFRLEVARQAGFWREAVPYAADTDMWFRMAFFAGARKLDRLMAGRTMHGEQRDKQGARIVRDYGLMLDQLQPLQQGPVRLRRASAAGRLRMTIRYQPQSGYWRNLAAQWRMVCLHPPLLQDIPVFSLVPGWFPIRAWLGRLRRSFSARKGSP
jgi:hypothetical protein